MPQLCARKMVSGRRGGRRRIYGSFSRAIVAAVANTTFETRSRRPDDPHCYCRIGRSLGCGERSAFPPVTLNLSLNLNLNRTCGPKKVERPDVSRRHLRYHPECSARLRDARRHFPTPAEAARPVPRADSSGITQRLVAFRFYLVSV